MSSDIECLDCGHKCHCEELSPGIKVRLPSWNTTDLFNRQYTQTANIMRWFVNYEESRKQYSKEKDNV